MRRARDFQDVLDAARHWAQGREFQIGLHVLLGLVDGDAASARLTEIAERLIQALLPRAEDWLSAQHGRVPGGAFVVLGLGKLGSRELSIGSDLDLIFVYDAPADARSDGARPLPAATYYARLGQRLVSALSAPTPEGRLYEIDTRLRPSGNLGPVACSADNFERYQLETAQTWEHQALTRARAVAGDPALARRVEMAVRRALLAPRDAEALARDVAAMRARIFREHGSDDPWHLKHVRGGLVELEFLAQFLKLRSAPEHPDLLTTGTVETFLRAAAAGILDPDDGAALVRAGRLYHRLQAVLRLAVQENFQPSRAPAGVRQALARAAFHDADALPAQPHEFADLERTLIEAELRVSEIFEALCPPVSGRRQAGPRRVIRLPAVDAREAGRSRDRGGPEMTVEAGQEAPEFDLPAAGGGRARLADFKGRPLVVYFYPKDDTPGCTREAQCFAAVYPEFQAAGVAVVGISKDSAASHDRFRAKYDLPFILASDEARRRGRGLWLLGREEHVWQEVQGDRPVDLSDRRKRARCVRSGATSKCRATSPRCWPRARALQSA